jgi:hypothetical protein
MAMTTYAVVERLGGVSLRLGPVGRGEPDAFAELAFVDLPPPALMDLTPTVPDTLRDRLESIHEAWSQATWYLFNAEGWR